MATVIQNQLKGLGDQFYREAIEHCRSYNARLCAERSVRMPFLDSQTGVAQNNCYIWMERRHRGPGLAAGQMYTYPARCWKKKRRLHAPIDPQLRLCELRLEAELMAKKEVPPTEATALEALLRGEGLLDKRSNAAKEEETLLEIQRVLDADENGDGFHDDDDFEVDTPKRKHRNKGRSRGSGRRRTEAVSGDDQDKPYVCDICGKRYKNRPGLSYHYTHTHLADEEGEEEQETEMPQSPPSHRPDNHKPQKGPDGTIIPNDYCDFCLGDSVSNRKTGQAEELVSCSDCGRSDAAMASWMNPPVIYPPLLAKGLSALLSARPPALTHPARARVYVEGLISVSCRPCCGTPSLPPCGSPSLSYSVWISLSPKRAHKRQRQ